MGDLSTRDGANAAEYISHMLRWEDRFLDMDIKELKKILYSPSYNRIMYIEMSWRQLKLPLSWYEEQCALVSYDETVIAREIDLKRLHGSEESPFSRKDLLYLSSHVPEPIDQRDYSNNLCPILIYRKIMLNKVYMLVADPSEGLAQDNNAMVLINPATQKIDAEFKSPYISQPQFCEMICTFLREFCPKSLIIVESNKGRELINCLMNTEFADQVYYDDGKLGDQVVDRTDPHGRLKQEATIRRAYGHWTGRNRSQYFGILENIMYEDKSKLLSKYLVEDVCGLIRKPGTGRVEAGKGSHDDIVMAYLIGLFIYYNLDYDILSRWGIHRGEVYDEEEYDTGNPEKKQEHDLREMADMLSSLPDNMRMLVQDALRQRDPVKDAQDFSRDVQTARSRFATDTDDESYGDLLPTAHPSDQARMSQFSDDIWGSNDPNRDFDDYGFALGGKEEFDPDDY